MKNSKAEDQLIKSLEISKSGYGGVDKNGAIVDRRKNPNAVPIAENKMMGIPAPKKITHTTHP